MVRARFFIHPSSGLREGCVYTCSVTRGWIQHPHECHPFRERLFRRFVPGRPESWMSVPARWPTRLLREPGRVQERLLCQSGQRPMFVVTVFLKVDFIMI